MLRPIHIIRLSLNYHVQVYNIIFMKLTVSWELSLLEPEAVAIVVWLAALLEEGSSTSSLYVNRDYRTSYIIIYMYMGK